MFFIESRLPSNSTIYCAFVLTSVYKVQWQLLWGVGYVHLFVNASMPRSASIMYPHNFNLCRIVLHSLALGTLHSWLEMYCHKRSPETLFEHSKKALQICRKGCCEHANQILLRCMEQWIYNLSQTLRNTTCSVFGSVMHQRYWQISWSQEHFH